MEHVYRDPATILPTVLQNVGPGILGKQSQVTGDIRVSHPSNKADLHIGKHI